MRRPSGELVPVVVGQDTVLALKSVLEEELGVPLEQQRLFFQGQPLENQVSLSQCGVQDKSEVGLVVMIPITVKTLTGQAFSLHVATNESVNEVKARVARETGVPQEQQRLLYGGMPMNDNSSLDAYEVSCGDEIYSIRRLRLYDIKVRRNKTKGHAIRLKVDASCTVTKLKNMIEAKEGTPHQLQQLTLSGVRLEDRRRIGYYHRLIYSKCTLVLRSEGEYQVFVRSVSGKTLTLGVRGGDSVQQLKSVIGERVGIPADQQRVLAGGRPLRDGRSLRECGIGRGSTLDLSLGLLGGMQIIVRCFQTGWVHTLEVASSDTIESVKTVIQEKEQIPLNEQRLTFHGKGLEDGKTLSDFHIRNEDTLILYRLRQGMQVFVRTLSGKIITAVVQPSSYLKEVKEQIQEKEGIPTGIQQLSFAGEFLEDTRTLSDYNIALQATLSLTVLVRRPGLTVVVHDVLNGRKHEVELACSDTVEVLKTKIEDETEIPVHCQKIIFCGKCLDDKLTIADYSFIREDPTLNLVCRLRLGILIYVRTPACKTINLEVETSDTIKNVKAKIQDKEGIPQDDQQLYYGKQLEDESTVCECKIQMASTLHLMVLPRMTVKIFLFSRTISLRVEPSITVEELKKIINEKEGIPEDTMRLVATGKQLDDGRGLNDCGIVDGSIIHNLPLSTGYMQIFVKIIGSRTIVVEVCADDAIENVKAKIQEIPLENQQLIFSGKILEDHRSLRSCGVKRDSTLILSTNLVYINTVTGRTIAIGVTMNDTIEDVQNRVQEELGVPLSAQHLYFGERLLDSRRTVNDYKIVNESTLTLKWGIVTFPTYNSRDLLVGLNENVREVKDRIERLEDIPSHRQRLMYAGVKLHDDKMITDYIINEPFVIECIFNGSVLLYIEVDMPTHHSRMCFQVMPDMKVLQVKRMIEQQRNIPTYLQTLLCGELKMENSKCLTEYNVEEQSTLQLVIEPQSGSTRMTVTVRSTWGAIEEVVLENTDKYHQPFLFSNVQKAVVFAGPPNRVYLGSTQLKENNACLITHNSTLFVTQPGEVPVVVRKSQRLEPLIIGVKPSNTVADLKSKVDRVVPGNQLFMGSVQLAESQTVAECGITAATEIILADPGTIPIFIRTRFREELLCCKPTCSVHDFKMKISTAMGIPKRCQRLIYNQGVLANETKKLTTYDIGPSSTVLVVSPNELDIHVTLPSRRIITLICSPDERVEDIKLKVEQSEGIPVEHQALLFDDKMTLREANITSGLHIQIFYGEFAGPLNPLISIMFSTDFSSYAEIDHIRTMDLYLRQKCRHVFQLQALSSDAHIISNLRKEVHEIEDSRNKTFAQFKKERREEREKLMGKALVVISSEQVKLDEIKQQQRIEEKHFKTKQRELKNLEDEFHVLMLHSTEQEEQKVQLEIRNQSLHEQLMASQDESQRLQRQFEETLTASQTESSVLQERLTVSEAESANLQERLTAALAELQVVSQRQCHVIDITPWNVQRSEIHTAEEIGRGGWGVVLRGRYEGEEVAVKQPHRDLLNERLLERLTRETRLMIQISHPNLVRIIAVVFDQAAESLRLPPLIVTELLDVNLRQCYQQRRLGAHNRIPVFQGAAKGLQHMHDCQEPIIHRDVSAPNVLLKALPNGRWKAKVSDFGSANLARLSVTAGEGAIIYTAPEAFPVRDPSSPRPVHTTKIDVFSFGILMCEVVTEQQPDPDLHQERLRQVQRLSRPLHSLIVRCTNHNPDQRPTMATVIQELSRISLP